ncbi:MAG: hypothetical protein ACREPM_15375 [Gemmatimonadaceae bacterium]
MAGHTEEECGGRRLNQSSIGVVNAVVTSAITTMMANSDREMNAGVQRDVQDHQFHQAARVHERAHRKRVACAHAGRPSRERGATQPARDRD